MWLPGAVGIFHPHHEDATVAVDVLLVEALASLLEGIGTHARAHETGPIRESQLGAVGIEARDHIEGAGVEHSRYAVVPAVATEEVVEKVERGGAAGDLGGVDIGVEPQRRLLLGGAGVQVGDGGEPDVAALIGLADALQPQQLGPALGPSLQQRAELVVAVETVERRRLLRRHLLRPGDRTRPRASTAAGCPGA
jgi:hypothetical protein